MVPLVQILLGWFVQEVRAGLQMKSGGVGDPSSRGDLPIVAAFVSLFNLTCDPGYGRRKNATPQGEIKAARTTFSYCNYQLQLSSAIDYQLQLPAVLTKKISVLLKIVVAPVHHAPKFPRSCYAGSMLSRASSISRLPESSSGTK